MAQPKFCNAAYASPRIQEAARKAVVPIETLGNQDVSRFDPVISVPPPALAKETVAPPARFWKVRVGEKTVGPMVKERHEEIVNSNVIFRVLMSAPLLWPGGPVGYLSALKEGSRWHCHCNNIDFASPCV